MYLPDEIFIVAVAIGGVEKCDAGVNGVVNERRKLKIMWEVKGIETAISLKAKMKENNL